MSHIDVRVMKKNKVAFFAEKLYGGGVEKILQIILRNFDYERYDVTLYSSLPESLKEGFYPIHLRHYSYFSSADGKLFTRLLRKISNKIRLWVYYHGTPQLFYRLFIREKYDVGIAFIEGYATRILSGAPADMRKIAWVHIELGNFHWTQVAFNNLEEEVSCYNKIDRVVCVSLMVKNQADQLFNTSAKSVVVYNPIERPAIWALSMQPVQEKELLAKLYQFRIVTLGTLNERKGHMRLLHVVKRLVEAGCDLELWILGEGEERQNLHDYIVANNLIDSVKLLGYHDNPFPYLRASDIYVCSSYAEGYNTAITEALVLGKAVVSTECSGVKEQLGENNEWGICTPNTEEGLYQGIKQMLSGNNLAHYTRQAEIRGEHFSLEKSMNDIYRLIDK